MDEYKVDINTIAQHEAGHAVMRWVLGLPATELTADDEGGLCAGTGRRIWISDEILVMLAGVAVESGYGVVGEVDLTRSKLGIWTKRENLSSGGATDSMRYLSAREPSEGRRNAPHELMIAAARERKE